MRNNALEECIWEGIKSWIREMRAFKRQEQLLPLFVSGFVEPFGWNGALEPHMKRSVPWNGEGVTILASCSRRFCVVQDGKRGAKPWGHSGTGAVSVSNLAGRNLRATEDARAGNDDAQPATRGRAL